MKPLGTKVLNTSRLVLRKIAKEDAESLFFPVVWEIVWKNQMKLLLTLRNHWIQSDGTYTNVHVYGLLASDI